MLNKNWCVATICVLVFGHAAFGSMVQAFQPANVSPNDGILWGAGGAGPLGSATPGSTGLTVTSALGLSITLKESGTFAVGQQGTTWIGNFPAGSYLINDQDGGPVNVTFGSAIRGFGLYIDNAFGGSYTGTIQVYDSGKNLLAAYTAQGSGLEYLGFRDTIPEATSVTLSTSNGNYFAMGDVNLRYFPGDTAPAPTPNDPSSTPEPASMITAGMALAMLGWRKRSSKGA